MYVISGEPVLRGPRGVISVGARPGVRASAVHFIHAPAGQMTPEV